MSPPAQQLLRTVAASAAGQPQGRNAGERGCVPLGKNWINKVETEDLKDQFPRGFPRRRQRARPTAGWINHRCLASQVAVLIWPRKGWLNRDKNGESGHNWPGGHESNAPIAVITSIAYLDTMGSLGSETDKMTNVHDVQNNEPQDIAIDDDWFDVLKISDYLFAISELRHFEHTVIYLLLGSDRAILIDTGCGIGNLRRVVEQLTSLPITVVNTHTHLDHLGSNHQFSEIMMFDHPRSRDLSSNGASQELLHWELHREELVIPPWPRDFRIEESALPPFKVSRWLEHDDVLEIGDIRLRVLHTPGEAPDHICLLDQTHGILFSGDILLDGAVWSHLDGGDVGELRDSYELLMRHFDEFAILMPSHNTPCQNKDLLPIALAASEDVLSGEAQPQPGIDLWGRHYNKYDFGRISILSRYPQ